LAGKAANVTVLAVTSWDCNREQEEKQLWLLHQPAENISVISLGFFLPNNSYYTAENPGQPKKSFQEDNIILCHSQSLALVRTTSSSQNERERKFTTFL